MTRDGCPAFLRGFPGAVLRLSPDGTVLDSNGHLERETGRELVGRPFREALDPESSGAKWERLLAGGGGAGEVWELVLRAGELVPEPRTFSVLPDAESESLWLVEHPVDARLERLRQEATAVNSELAGTQRALSKEKAQLARALAELEERGRELERSNRELDQFAHIVSHDLKAPLRSIRSHADWLLEDIGPALPQEQREQLERIRTRAAEMEAMIRGILDYARLGRAADEPEAVAVASVVMRVLELLDPPAGAVIEVQPDLPTLHAHRVQLEQVFLNLIGNALKYGGGARARVRVGARRVGEFYEFSVADQGPGIPARLRERIWGMFFTSHDGDTEGTGIGLAVVKKLVEVNGGRAWVESEPGAGATFLFLWPAQASERR